MNPELNEQLRQSMEQFTDHVVMPLGLAQSAYRRLQKRRVNGRAARATAAGAASSGTVTLIT
jgi:hypothetical protein